MKNCFKLKAITTAPQAVIWAWDDISHNDPKVEFNTIF